MSSVQYSLYNIDNYKKNLDSSTKDIIGKYNLLITDYYLYIFEKIKLINTDYNNFIIMRGLETITHVFCMMLFYSKNLDMTYYHSQKAFYFYVEFIEQITDKQNFLQLSSRDASMFVYKKTIFDINHKNQNKKQISEKDKIKIDILDIYTSTIKLLFEHKFDKQLLVIFKQCHTIEDYKHIYTLIHNCINQKMFFIIELFVKSNMKLRNYTLNEFNNKIVELEPTKFISWITTNSQ
jgi:hypothetical protein